MSDAFGGIPSPPEPRPTEATAAPWFSPSPAPSRRLWLHAGLLLATFVTTSIAGSWFWEGTLDFRLPWTELLAFGRIAQGVEYSLVLLLILGAHEMGHYFACRYYGVPATLPFFIPGPPMPVGTFGAVIRIRGLIPSRRALFDIAAAGPIAGFLVAVPILVIGVARAVEMPPDADVHGLGLGPPLLSTLLERLFHGASDLQVGSLYGAAWVGMLVTSLNLFPVGQLDGGHAFFAISRRAHPTVSWITILAMAIWVVEQTITKGTWSAYTTWLIVLLIMRARHPRLRDEGEPLGPVRIALALLLAAIFVLTFIPTPIVVT